MNAYFSNKEVQDVIEFLKVFFFFFFFVRQQVHYKTLTALKCHSREHVQRFSIAFTSKKEFAINPIR